jgi:valyl-tRNA synthetase
MPFITEEIWQLLKDRKEGESVMMTLIPKTSKYNHEMVTAFETVKETISAVRSVRKDKDIPNKEKLELHILSDSNNIVSAYLSVIKKLCNLSEVKFVSEKKDGAASFMTGTTEFFIPLEGKLDVEAELSKIREEIEYHKGFLNSVMKKLGNERFVQNAPAAVLDLERKKKSDAESKIASLEERKRELKSL